MTNIEKDEPQTDVKNPQSDALDQAKIMLMDLIQQGYSPEETSQIIKEGLDTPAIVDFVKNEGVDDEALDLLGKFAENLSPKG